MNKLSPRQEAILTYIKQEVRAKGYPPSVREIGEAVGLASSSTVHGHLARLEKKGLIRRDPTKPRAIEVLEETLDSIPDITSSTVMVPYIGKVTAGEPITAIENIEDYFPIPRRMVGSEDSVFLLSVRGDSMINIGVLERDYVLVRQQQVADNGDIIVAMTPDNEATVKRFYKEKNHVRLQPENDHMEPLIYPEVTILGKVIGLYRELH
ncbi:transcriptional repressor LexA [Marininema halotolerans]|uniref:LexA repressor n=1 Tax=Marininema halotolerans TaxID=1155944 RepID=A0A1I6R892_9BACL|nr:transcriptional repressor LexA [Marininema halotolerans]SFS60931.1 repressor LexA [Marininema halotolerans]